MKEVRIYVEGGGAPIRTDASGASPRTPEPMKLTSPDLDFLLEHGARGREAGSMNPELFAAVRETRNLLGSVRPRSEGRDSIWSLWLRTERGSIEDFGDWKEYRDAGEVESYEEFEGWWLAEYPEPVQWRRLTIIHYDDQLHFALEGKLRFFVDLARASFSVDLNDEDTRRLLEWLLDSIRSEVRRFVRDPAGYNREISQRLPWARRFGRILRKDLWEGAPDAFHPERQLDQEELDQFEHLVSELDEHSTFDPPSIPPCDKGGRPRPSQETLDTMTQADFLGYCEICYDANDYESIEPGSSPREKYRAMADNRDEGLLDLPPDDPDAFARWFRHRSRIGHPWEICRGGNRTHISLQVVALEGAWQLYLAGFSTVRAVETARMAIALAAHGVPFVLVHKEEMLRMLTGRDDVGIVAADVPLGYNHGDFPPEDRIHSFIHLALIEELNPTLREKITWYPLDELVLQDSGR